jgi:uncharacterized coiled-coil protein SlyX
MNLEQMQHKMRLLFEKLKQNSSAQIPWKFLGLRR